MRLIDADALKEEICKCYRHFSQRLAISPVFEEIKKAPTIDAVPVVRCKDCFYHGDFDENGYCVCKCTGAGMPMHGFCSDGERKKWL